MPVKIVDTAIKIILGPCIDDGDFKAREEGLTYDQAGMEIDIILEKPDGSVTTTALTPTTGDDHDWAHTDQGYYELEIPASGGDYNNDAEGILHAVGYCTGVLPFRSVAYDVVSATRGLAGTALPDAAADAAGGVPISDTGNLDLDTKLANTHEVTAARMGALTDLIDGGRLDALIDLILEDTGTTLQGELDGIQADTEDIQTQIGTAGDGLTAVVWNADWDAEVQSECADALTAYAPPTKAEMDTGHGLLATEAKQDIIDTAVDAILDDTGTNGVVLKAAGLDADAANEISDALLDRANGIETGYTLRQSLRIILAALAGKLSGAATTTVTIRDVNDTTDRMVATVDADGNRSATTPDGT